MSISSGSGSVSEVISLAELTDVTATTGTGTTAVLQGSPTVTTPTIAQINGSTSAAGTVTINATTHATAGAVIFLTKSGNEAARFLATSGPNNGVFLIGRTTVNQTDDALNIQHDANGSVHLTALNASNGASALIAWKCINDGTKALSVGVKSSAFTGDSDTAFIQSNATRLALDQMTTGGSIVFRSDSVDICEVVRTGTSSRFLPSTDNAALLGKDDKRWLEMNGFIHGFYSMTPPTAVTAKAQMYCDTSGGKLRIMVIFPTGAAQQIAIEP